jgi:hypothetical protein
MQAIQNQMRWAENQMHRLEAQRSIVRTLAYSPQDSEMQRCMNAILQPVQFPGFGRGIATRTFQEALSTVRAHATPTNTPGFGTPEGSSVLVPWFLVSSPSYDRATNALVAPAAPSSAPPTGTGRTTGRTLGTGTATGQTPSGSSAPPTQNGTGTSRPWWEE